MSVITRFAPSPTGHLHLGHAYSALFAEQCAQRQAGLFLLRIEDIDASRCKPEFDQAIQEDLAWLGLNWQQPVRRQSEHLDDYAQALEHLDQKGLLYPCFCTRKDIQAEILAAGYAPHAAPTGPEGPVYPGTCRHLSETERQQKLTAGTPYALRLKTDMALSQTGPLTWHDNIRGKQMATPEQFGDPVLARKDIATSYHLAVTLDDHQQGITLVTRGEDLFSATHLHRLLQAVLELDTPAYHHHPLLTDDAGHRYAKRDNALTLRNLREAGHTAAEVRKMAYADL